MNFKHTVRNICFGTLICCLSVGGGLDMAVICYSEDGQAAIEAAIGSNCANTPAAHSRQIATPATENQFSSEDDCGNCLDLRLSIEPAVAAKKLCKINIAAAAWIHVPAITAGTADSSQSLLPPEFVPPPPSPAPLESVVLLI